MPFRFLCPGPDGAVSDFAVDALTLPDAFQRFAANHWKPGMTGTFAVWCGRRLAGHVRIDEGGPVLTDMKTEPPSHANPFACGD